MTWRYRLLVLSLATIGVIPIGTLLKGSGSFVFGVENPTETYRSWAEDGEFVAVAQHSENSKLHFFSFDGVQKDVTFGERFFGEIRPHQCIEICPWQYDALRTSGLHGQIPWGQRKAPIPEVSIDENVNQIDRSLSSVMSDKANHLWQIVWEPCCADPNDGNRPSLALNKRPDLDHGGYRQNAREDFYGSEPGNDTMQQRYLTMPPSFRWLGRGLIGASGIGYLAAMLISANGRGNGLWMLASFGAYLAASCLGFAGLVLSSPF
jgi:hypothetical protein